MTHNVSVWKETSCVDTATPGQAGRWKVNVLLLEQRSGNGKVPSGGGLFPRRTEMDDGAWAPEPKHRPTLVFSGI